MRTCEASMPCDSKFVIVAGPKRSSPTRATIDTSAPHSRAATAWLAPLPPQPRSKCSPKIVSPAFGNRSEKVVRSTFALPTTAILDRLVMSPLFAAISGSSTGRTVRRTSAGRGPTARSPPATTTPSSGDAAAAPGGPGISLLDEDGLAVAGAVIDVDVDVELLLLGDDARVEERQHRDLVPHESAAAALARSA